MYIWLFRKVGKRKAVAKADKSSKRQPKKQRDAKKDPNKPKRPPSAFFVFLYVSLSLLPFQVDLLGFGRYEFEDISDPCLVNPIVRSSGRTSRKNTLILKLFQP
jgi:hypothetical protein